MAETAPMSDQFRARLQAPEAEAPSETRGTYNCPVCGWNEPHSEHAGEIIRRLLQAHADWQQRWKDLATLRRDIQVYLHHASVVESNRVVPTHVLQSWQATLDRALPVDMAARAAAPEAKS